jgi:hypothetical protein
VGLRRLEPQPWTFLLGRIAVATSSSLGIR